MAGRTPVRKRRPGFWLLALALPLGVPAAPARAQATARAPAAAYPLRLSANGAYLADQKGKPFFATGEDAWCLATQLDDDDVEAYLSNRASLGYNSLWIALADNVYQADPPRDHYGNRPFDGPDFTREDPAYWAHLDRVIERAAAHGFAIWASPGFVGLKPTQGYQSSYLNSSDAVIAAYGRWLGERYRKFPNLVWVLGGDCDPTMPGILRKMDDLGSAIASADPNHLLTFEAARFTSAGAAPGGGYSSVQAFQSQDWIVPSWLGVNWVYQTAPTCASGANANYRGRPFLAPILGEDWYELENSTTPLILREEAYGAVLGGAYNGRIFGNDAIWSFNSPNAEAAGDPPWKSQLDSPGSRSQEFLGALFRSREFWRLVPDYGVNEVLTAGYGSGAARSLAARTSDGRTIIGYVPNGNATTVTVDLRRISDTSARIWWYDPQTGASRLAGEFPTTGPKRLTPPDGRDWVFVIDAAGAHLPAPGTAPARP